MSLTNPAPGGQLGRTDQGVDWSNIRGNIVAVAGGVITNVYQSLQGFGQTIIERINGGQEVYYGLETGGRSTIRTGTRVRAGQSIASGLGTGGIEVGYWDPSTGRAVGAPEFSGSNPTPAGRAFRSRLNLGGGGAPNNLEQLWIQAGGPASQAPIAAAVAMAESGGQLDATHKNSDGSTDYGPWQVNSVHSQFDPQRLTSDPLYNAQAAVSVWRSSGWEAWTTYKTGAYKKFLGHAKAAVVNYGGPNGGIVRPGGQPVDSGAGIDQTLQDYVSLRDQPRTAPPNTKNPFQWWWASFRGDWSQVKGSSGVLP